MRFDLRKPCATCPFRRDMPKFLSRARATQITDVLLHEDFTFACHKSTTEKRRSWKHKDAQHCAGALIFVARNGNPNGMLQIAERLGLYDPSRLDMTADIYATQEEMISRSA